MSLAPRIRSTMMSVMSSERLANWQRGKARYLRHFRAEKPKVLYFHQAGDPYSHLAVQKLDALKQQYEIDFVVHLVHPSEPSYQGDPEKFSHWARNDAAAIAAYFGTRFKPGAPSEHAVAVANGLLAKCIGHQDFATSAIAIGEQLWSGTLEDQEADRAAAQLNKGTQLRARLGHYAGAMFYFEGEWFWGVDRLHLLEQRLQDEGFGSGPYVCPLPQVSDFACGKVNDAVQVEYFPSLRSPYTAVGHQRVLDLAESVGIELKLRPVMPMMMRGIPAPFKKQRYIMSDSGREARFYGVALGPFCDPFGEPVKQAFAAYHAATMKDLGMAFVTEYLRASFAEGLNIREREGLAEVCRRAGFDLDGVDPDADWQSALEANLSVMAEGSLWGVPSFRVTGGVDPAPFSCWGQDRIWRVAAEIARRSEVESEGASGGD